ncbi:helix-turn-helix domain-containing protein [Ktedonosporobacter rubrisoli]|uniref:Helix-turn-helix domain-containing protein n=1 Tax=Ktedonosporobacter rubrisoli TaxID=2509675 RepID=A0A4P6K5W7_KTERU|nr:helix-turn-helix domain-containing protein [Ktedonosporobacter rubrisoli]QBD82946.1 helix-turn-helix domain-containing protein [Ktedonosporobacter rubrisoli]
MTIDLDTEAFGALLRAFRKRASITQEQLARNIGMQRHAIIRWEQGEVLPASKAIVLELGKHLKLDEQETRRLLEVSLTAPSPIWGVPFPRNLVFTGHEDTLELLQRFLSPARSVSLPKLVSLHGLAGVGKTQLALEIAYRCVLEYRAIFWIEAETAERVLSSLERVARLLGLTKDGVVDQQRIIEDVIHWLSTHDKWLLIWDNIEDLDLLQRFLSLSWQGAFLLTTRQQGLSTLARSIEVLPLEEEAALLLLLRRAGMAEHASGPEQIFRLAEQEPATYDAAIQLVELLGDCLWRLIKLEPM